MVTERRPICRIENLVNGVANAAGNNDIDTNQAEPSRVMRCKIGFKKLKIRVPVKTCKSFPRDYKRCAKTVKIIKENREKNVCSFIPQKFCHGSKAETAANIP